MNLELPDVQAGFKKDRGTIDQIANISWIIEKAREFQKNIYFCFMDYAKAFDSVDSALGKSKGYRLLLCIDNNITEIIYLSTSCLIWPKIPSETCLFRFISGIRHLW